MKGDIEFAQRMQSIKPSFIREILKAADNPQIISFAGGLPNKDYFPCEALAEICARLMKNQPTQMLQYGQSEGEIELRETIAQRYREDQKIDITAKNILITTGSQQGLDLIGKLLLNAGDPVVIEAPGYLGAIQSLMLYQPQFLPVAIDAQGMNIETFEAAMSSKPRLIYTVPNFQNPSGYSYAQSNREAMAELITHSNSVLIEDDPYGDIRFEGDRAESFYHYLPDQTLILGSSSKIIAPGLRVGWIVAAESMIEKLVIAKQAADLHSPRLSQFMILEFLRDSKFPSHLRRLCEAYRNRRDRMAQSLDNLFGQQIKRSHPLGGMFMWLEFGAHIDTMELFKQAASLGIVFVPGQPFYTDQKIRHSARLNFSCANLEDIETGVKKLHQAFQGYSA